HDFEYHRESVWGDEQGLALRTLGQRPGNQLAQSQLQRRLLAFRRGHVRFRNHAGDLSLSVPNHHSCAQSARWPDNGLLRYALRLAGWARTEKAPLPVHRSSPAATPSSSSPKRVAHSGPNSTARTTTAAGWSAGVGIAAR